MSDEWRKKPVVVRAVRWFSNGDHPDDYEDSAEGRERRDNGWEGAVVRFFRRPEPEYADDVLHEPCGHSWHEHGWIDTLEGGHTVCPGDWIITGVQGEHYPCKPDIFDATYEPASAHPVTALPEDVRKRAEGLAMLIEGMEGDKRAEVFVRMYGGHSAPQLLAADLRALLAAARGSEPESESGYEEAIRTVRAMTGGTYDQEVEREAVAQRLEDLRDAKPLAPRLGTETTGGGQ